MKKNKVRLMNWLVLSLFFVGNFAPSAIVMAETLSSGETVSTVENNSAATTDGETSHEAVVEKENEGADVGENGNNGVPNANEPNPDANEAGGKDKAAESSTDNEKEILLNDDSSNQPEVKNNSASQEETKKVTKEVKKETKKITVLGTSDVHGNVWDWSYEDDKEADLGFGKIGTVVKKVRSENPNTILVDAGDTLQGTLLTDDLYSTDPEFFKDNHPVITAMNVIGYDSMSLGNHEFNFGLGLINKVRKEAEFPLLSANTYLKGTNENFVEAYKIKTIDGVKVAVIGLTIPHVPQWDGEKVASLEFKSLRKEARKQVDIINEKENPDVIVAAIHAGLDNSDPEAAARNVILEVPEIDAFVLGHDHREFAEMINDGTGKAKPAAAVKDTGAGVVRIDIEVEKEVPATEEEAKDKEKVETSDVAESKNKKEWTVVKSTPSIISTKGVATDEAVRAATKAAHEATQKYVNGVIGTATGDFLPKNEIPGIPEAQLEPTAMISLINNVQIHATGADIAAGALFRADSDLKAGPVSFSDIFNIYKYPNTLVGTTITGKELKRYMESQAGYYQQYEAGDLTIAFNPKVRVYNYDMVTGVKYKIDISKPVGERIVDLTYKGEELPDDKVLKIAINNYRFEGMVKGGYVNPTPYYESDPDTLRGEIVKYISEYRQGTIDPAQELEESFEIIGADLAHPARDYVIGQIKAKAPGFADLIQTEKDGRTPNVKKVNINDLIAQNLIPAEYLDEDFSFSIMHTNDMHGRLEFEKDKTLGMARLKTYKDKINPTLMLDGGDSLQGLAISNFGEGMDMAKAMSLLPYDAVAAGNHEFDFGYDRAMAFKQLLPMLSANAIKDGKTSFDAHKIVKKDGKNFALIGLSTPETAFKTHPKNVEGVVFEEPIKVAKEQINELKGQADVFVFVTHLGIDKTTPEPWRGDTLAKELSKEFPEQIIIIIDGHSHSELNNDKSKDFPTIYGNVLLAQTGNYLNNVGLIKVSAKDGKASFDAKLVPTKELNDTLANPEVDEIVQATKAKFDQEMSEIVLEDNPVYFEGDGQYGRTRETNLGNIIGDALFDYAQTAFSTPADLAVINGGGIRVSIDQGKVTKGDVLAVLPFGNTIAQIDITGAQIYEMFEHSLRAEAQVDGEGKIILDDKGLPLLGRNGGYLQVSHSVKIIYDSNLLGALPEEGRAGERVLQVQLLNRQTNQFEPINREATYKIATNDFLAAGGDGYTMLGGKREEGISMDGIFTDFLQKLTTSPKAKVVPLASAKYNIMDYEELFPYSRIIPMTKADFEGQQVTDLDLAGLEAEIAKAEKLVEKDYTAKSWTVFSQALVTAKEFLVTAKAEGTTITQPEVDQAVKDLADAQEQLVLVKPTEPTELNYAALEKAIADAETKKESAYTKESWQVFAKALAEAKGIVAAKDEKLSQLVIDEATDKLIEAQKNLVLVATPGKQKPGTTKPGKGVLPKTGEAIYTGVIPGLALVGGAAVVYYRKRRVAAKK